MQVTVHSRQTLFDMALQEIGDITGVFSLAEENDLSITDELQVGQVLTFTGVIINPQIRKHYQTLRIKPATGINKSYKRSRVFSREYGIEFN